MNKSKVYNIAKLIAIILVVFAHCSRMYTELGGVHPILSSNLLSKVTTYIYSFHMPLFFMVSGAVFAYCLDDGKYKATIRFIINKIKRLIFPYWIFGLFYVTPVMIYFHFTSLSVKDYIFSGILLSRDSRHLWYVLALFWIYLVAIFVKKTYYHRYSFYIVFIISIALCLFSNSITFDFRFRSTAYYQLFFFIGMLINKIYTKLENLISYKLFISILLGIALLIQFQWNTFFAKILYGVVGSFMVLLFCMWALQWNIWTKTITKNIIKNSYGIYFFHPMIIYILFYYLSNRQISPSFLCFGVFIISFSLSYALTWFIRKIKIGFVIGE